MKKLILIIGIAIIAINASSQTSVRMVSEQVGFWTIEADTMNILPTDNVVSASIVNPQNTTDSVTISGCSFEIDGISSNGVKIPPGEAAMNLHFRYAKLDTITIACPSKAWVVLLIDNN